ncbi:hypothetical protein GCM10010315_26300 [Streptomyces luteosporeus]|uniref:SapB/AmfS family lantipeptide n=1 Tax=Streptomyces luteosporeus TaxID=173856 RepID=A0ABN3TRB5_9ACTN
MVLLDLQVMGVEDGEEARLELGRSIGDGTSDVSLLLCLGGE